jgi:hypothetical protein
VLQALSGKYGYLKPKVVYWKYCMALSMLFKCSWVFGNGSDMSNSLIGREDTLRYPEPQTWKESSDTGEKM